MKSITNLFYKILKEKEVINDVWGISDNEAIQLSLELEKAVEKLILNKIKQTNSAEAKNALIDVLSEIKNIDV